jgi:hypothetical protein
MGKRESEDHAMSDTPNRCGRRGPPPSDRIGSRALREEDRFMRKHGGVAATLYYRLVSLSLRDVVHDLRMSLEGRVARRRSRRFGCSEPRGDERSGRIE